MNKKIFLCIGVGAISICSAAVAIHFAVKKHKETKLINELNAIGIDINDPNIFPTC